MSDKRIYIKTKALTQIEQEQAIETMIADEDNINKVTFTKDNWIEIEPKRATPVTLFYSSIDMSKLRLPKDIIYIEGEPGIRYPIESIAIEQSELIRQEIEYENKNFSLESFYQEQKDRAVCVITPEETINVLSWIDHGRATLRVYNMLYNENKKMWDSPIWQFGAMEKGNVVIQLSHRECSPVWLPWEINDYQYGVLVGMIERMKEINKQGDYNIELALDFDTQVGIENAKEELDRICTEKKIYEIPKKK